MLHTFFGNNRENRFSYFPSQNHALNSYITYDLIVYGATRKKGIFPEDQSPMLVPGSFGIAGLNLNPLYHFSNYFRAGISLDLQYDESANIGKHIANTYIPSEPEELRFYRPPFREQFSAGLSLRGEIVMPIFSINLGIGKKTFCARETIRTHFTKLLCSRPILPITCSCIRAISYTVLKIRTT